MTYVEFIQSIQESRENTYFPYSERHHIIPRCLGGTDEEDNLIYLTYREHFIAHNLLMKENPDNRNLILAVHFMSLDGDHETTPEEYEEARRKFVESQIGNTYGSLCRHTEEFKENLRKRNRKGLTEESRHKIAEAHMGTKASEETKKKKMAISHTGLKMPPRQYHMMCQLCHKEFLANSPKVKYCSICDIIVKEEKAKNRRTKSEAAKVRVCHLICKSCGKEFISRGPNRYYCDECNR